MIKNKQILAIAAIAAGLTFGAACSEVDNPEHPAAATSAAGDVTIAKDTLSAHEIDTSAASSFEFIGAKVTDDHLGGFGSWNGTVYMEDDVVRAVEITIDASTIFADVEKLTEHLRSPDFFHVEQFREVKFVSNNVTEGGDGGTHTVTGNLTMHGVTKQITFPVTISREGELVRTESAFTIDRFDWGIVYPGKSDDLIRNDVLIRFNLLTGS